MGRLAAQVAMLAALLAASLVRNSVWKDEGTFWLDTIAKSPRKARAYNEYALHVMQEGKYAEALSALNRSLELNRYQQEAYINLGLAYEGLGRIDDAIRAYERAIFVEPRDPTPRYNLGVLYYDKLRDPETAFGYFISARDLNPLEPDVHSYLSRIYHARGEQTKAGEEWALYLKLK